MIKYLLPLTLAVAVALPLTFADLNAADRTDTTTTTTTSTALSKDDIKFLQMANQGGLLEIKTSELLAKRNANVTGAPADFAKKMITDHEAVNKELATLASKKGVTLPTALDEDTQKKYDGLVKTEDAKLAKEYMECQIKAHKAAVSGFKDAADDSKDVDVKAFAAKHLPHLQAHLDEAKRVEDTL